MSVLSGNWKTGIEDTSLTPLNDGDKIGDNFVIQIYGVLTILIQVEYLEHFDVD